VVTSAEVYGAVPAEEMPVREDRPPAPRTAYGVSKAAADLIAARAGPTWRLSVLRMRPFNHVGPGQRLGFVAPDFAAQVAAAERGLAPPVIRVGDLSGRRDFTDVRDIVAGYRAALDRGSPGEAYNLCSGRSVAIEEILRFFVDRARVTIEIRRDERRLRPVEVAEFRGDGRRAAGELGWKPEIPLDRSLSEVLEEWRAAPDDALPAAD
jgi:GDP-4-dehydro-6-deoxy-D-mannose reductase